jgi:hypothetical protein
MQQKVGDQSFAIRAREGASFSLCSKENFEKRRIKRDAGRLFFLVRRSRGEAGWILWASKEKYR